MNGRDTASCEGTKAARCVVVARTVRGGGTRASYAHARVAHAPAVVALTGTDMTCVYVPGSSRVQTRGRHVSWEGKGTVVVTSRCTHACAYIFFVPAKPITSLPPSESPASSSSRSSSRLVVLRAKNGAPRCAGPVARFLPIMGAVGWNERPNGRATDRHAAGARPPPESAEVAGTTTFPQLVWLFPNASLFCSYPFWL